MMLRQIYSHKAVLEHDKKIEKMNINYLHDSTLSLLSRRLRGTILAFGWLHDEGLVHASVLLANKQKK